MALPGCRARGCGKEISDKSAVTMKRLAESKLQDEIDPQIRKASDILRQLVKPELHNSFSN